MAAPIIKNFDGDRIVFQLGFGPVFLDARGTGTDNHGVAPLVLGLSDVDSANFDSGALTVSVSGNSVASEDVLLLEIGGTLGVTLSGGDAQIDVGEIVSVGGMAIGVIAANGDGRNGNALIVTFNTDATVARVETLLRALQYENESANPTTAPRTLDLTVSDGDGGTSAVQNIAVVIQVPATAVFTDSGQLLGSSNSFGVSLGDVDGDGDLDMVVANSAGDANQVFLNDGLGAYTDSGQDLGSTSAGIALGDVDSDGDLDVVVAKGGSQANQVWLNDGSGVYADSGQVLGTGASEHVALGDVDGDGDLDMVVANLGANRVWLNDGSGSYADSGQALGSSNSFGVSLGDVDGDNDLDLVVANRNQANRVWLNDGSGTYTDSGQTLGLESSQAISLGDVDGDGDLDMVVANVGQANRVYLNDGSGTFSDSGQSLSPRGAGNSFGVSLGDVDGDGDLDMVVASYNFQPNKVWLNDGSGTYTDTGQALGSNHSLDVTLGDVDGDGDLDMIVANLGGANRVWLNNQAPVIALDDTALDYIENDLALQLDAAALLFDREGDGEWNGGTLLVQMTANAEAEDVIGIGDNVVGSIHTDGTDLRSGVTVIGALSASEGTVTDGTALAINFNAAATNALVQQVLRAVQYHSTSENPGANDRSVSFMATDATGASVSDTRTVSVTRVNDAPVVNDDLSSSSIIETVLANDLVIGTFTAADPESDAFDLSTSDSRFEVRATGTPGTFELVALAGSNFDFEQEASVNVTVTATETTTSPALSGNRTFTVNISDVAQEMIDGSFVSSNLTLIALGPDDMSLTGGSGNDNLITDKGRDILIGGEGRDRMAGGEGNDLYYVDNSGDVIVEAVGGGNDRVATNVDFDLTPGAEIELFTTTSVGGTDPLRLTGKFLCPDHRWQCGSQPAGGPRWRRHPPRPCGNDILLGGRGNDRLIGGEDFDTADYSDSDAAVTISLLTGLISGGFATGDLLSSIENLTGSDFDDNLTGDLGKNVLMGGAGNDLLNGRNGADGLHGGAGNDTMLVDNAGDRVFENAGEGIADRVAANVNYTLTAGAEVELFTTTSVNGTKPLQLTGNEFAQTIIGNAGDNVLNDGNVGGSDLLRGLGGNDVYIVRNMGTLIEEVASQGSNDRVAASTDYALGAGVHVERLSTTSNGGLANINLTGNALAQTIIGNAGRNVLHDGGPGASNVLRGLEGDDLYRIYNSGDVVIEEALGGFDRIASAVDYVLAAGVHVEQLGTNGSVGTAAINLTGNELSQTIFGNAGDNVLSDGGGAGADDLRGLGGNDTYIVRNGGTTIAEGAGEGTNDRVAAAVDYALGADDQIELLTTTSTGSTTGIDLTGNAFAQTIVGNAGSNILRSGTGAPDILRGLGGNDVYRVFNSGDRIIETAGQGSADRVITTVTYNLATGVDVERLQTDATGGTSNIALIGNEIGQTVIGNAGENYIRGQKGADVLYACWATTSSPTSPAILPAARATSSRTSTKHPATPTYCACRAAPLTTPSPTSAPTCKSPTTPARHDNVEQFLGRTTGCCADELFLKQPWCHRWRVCLPVKLLVPGPTII